MRKVQLTAGSLLLFHHVSRGEEERVLSRHHRDRVNVIVPRVRPFNSQGSPSHSTASARSRFISGERKAHENEINISEGDFRVWRTPTSSTLRAAATADNRYPCCAYSPPCTPASILRPPSPRCCTLFPLTQPWLVATAAAATLSASSTSRERLSRASARLALDSRLNLKLSMPHRHLPLSFVPA